MQIRTFQATTVQGAMQQVKKELGPDAVILGNRRIKVTPTRSLIEITAARDPVESQQVVELPSSGDRRQVGEDIREIKGLLSMLISSKNTFSQLQPQEPVARVYHHLLMRGLDEKQTFICPQEGTRSRMNGSPLDERRVMHGFCRQLLEKISIVTPFRDSVPVRPDVFAFIGPGRNLGIKGKFVNGVAKDHAALFQVAFSRQIHRKVELDDQVWYLDAAGSG